MRKPNSKRRTLSYSNIKTPNRTRQRKRPRTNRSSLSAAYDLRSVSGTDLLRSRPNARKASRPVSWRCYERRAARPSMP